MPSVNTRDIFLGPFEAGSLQGAAEALFPKEGSSEVQPSHQKLDTSKDGRAAGERLFNALCATLLQAGARRILIPGARAQYFTQSEFLLKKIDTSMHGPAEKAWFQVVDIFEGVAHADPEASTPQRPKRVQYLVADMIRCFEAGTSMVVAAALPEPDHEAPGVPVDLMLPIQNILKSMRPAEVSAVVPTTELRRRDLQLLTELFASDLYAEYASSHELLATTEVPTKDAAGEISSRASALVRSFGKRIATSNRLVTLLPSSPKLVESISGKISGALAAAMVGPLTTWLNARSRLVVYRFDPTIRALSKAAALKAALSGKRQ